MTYTNNNASADGCVSARKRTMTRSKKRLIFYILMMIVPILQFVLFYGYVNFNSILMAFRTYVPDKGFEFVWFENFKTAFSILFEDWSRIENSLILYLVNLVIVMGLALVFSYYIAKKYVLSGTFRVVLYLPQIVSSVVFVKIYQILTTDISVELFGFELLMGHDTKFMTVLIFNIWLGFGTNVMLFTGAMSGISQSIIESAHIDGVNIVQEFIYITIPSIWGTFVTFVVVGISQIFLNQMHLFTFFGGTEIEVETIGYYFYKLTQQGAVSTAGGGREGAWKIVVAGQTSYYELSALGIIITVILVPLTLFIKWLLEKYGPSVE